MRHVQVSAASAAPAGISCSCGNSGQTISMTGFAVTTVAFPLVAIAVLGASAVEVGCWAIVAHLRRLHPGVASRGRGGGPA